MATRATDLAGLTSSMRPEPLIGDYEFEAFYRGAGSIKTVRGADAVARMKVGLDRRSQDPFYKAFLMGRSGVGKSTEITRLLRDVRRTYAGIRFSVRKELDPKNFTPFDVILLMMILLVEQTNEVTGKTPNKELVADLLGWFADERETLTKEVEAGVEAVGGLDTKDTWWGKVIGAFASIKGSLAYSQQRKTEVVAYKLTRISELVATANSLLRHCRELLHGHDGRDWLFIGEEFDKSGVPSERTIDLFLNHGNAVFQDLETNLIFNMPLGLAFGARNAELPPIAKEVLYDTPVFTKDRQPHDAGRDFARQIVLARAEPDLFAEGQLDRLIIASGANLRELFSMIQEAATSARVEQRNQITDEDVSGVIRRWTSTYESKLGQTQYDVEKIDNKVKIDRLESVYRRNDPAAELPDNVLGILLQANAVQEFNGEHWIAVHPLMVRVLAKFRDLGDAAGGAT